MLRNSQIIAFVGIKKVYPCHFRYCIRCKASSFSSTAPLFLSKAGSELGYPGFKPCQLLAELLGSGKSGLMHTCRRCILLSKTSSSFEFVKSNLSNNRFVRVVELSYDAGNIMVVKSSSSHQTVHG